MHPLIVGFAGMIFFKLGMDTFKKIKVIDIVKKDVTNSFIKLFSFVLVLYYL